MTIPGTRCFMMVSVAALLFLGTGGAQAEGDDAGAVTRGARAWADHCGRCHNIRAPKELADAEWDVVVTHMQVRANLPGSTARDIKAFLKGAN